MRVVFYFIIVVTVAIVVSSCATIVGGAKYVAEVQVPDFPNANIKYQGTSRGMGVATFKVPRAEANNFSVTIDHEGCRTQTTKFTKKTFRGWAFTGTLLGWTGFIQGIPVPIPWGILVDGSTGALWKPDINEEGVSKKDYDHYVYRIDYRGCNNEVSSDSQSKSE